ncbi:MAG: ribose-5-phosphate isomerase RpiA [Chloroflexota bacterium]|nr:ribose-5-phosphate isomerase RpiA [Chloroflexota bacterium]
MDDAFRLDTLARFVAGRVIEGQTLGLGTGATAEAVIRAIGERVAHGLQVRGVATSRQSAAVAEKAGIGLVTLDTFSRIDLGIDGADEIDPQLDVVKGRGGALLHEKLVALVCADYWIVGASEKLVPELGTRLPLPVEVVPFGWSTTAQRLAALGINPTLRTIAVDYEPAPSLTDGGNYILDCASGPIDNPHALAAAIKAIPGVVEHGLFLDLARRVITVDAAGHVEEQQR